MILVWWITCLLWSSTFLFIRIGLHEIPPFTFAWVRLALAAALFGPIIAWRGEWQSIAASDLAQIAIGGLLLLGANYALVFWGAQFVPSGLVAILLSFTPILALLFAWGLGLERPTLRRVGTLTCGIAGVILIFGAEARVSGRLAVVGAAAVLGAAASVAFGYVWLKRRAARLPPVPIAALQSLVAAAALSVLGLALEGPPALAAWSAASWGALLYLAVAASVVAFSLNCWLLARMDASAMLLMGIAEVPIAIGLGALILGERLPPGTWLGAACIVAALAGGLLGVGTRRPHPAER